MTKQLKYIMYSGVMQIVSLVCLIAVPLIDYIFGIPREFVLTTGKVCLFIIGIIPISWMTIFLISVIKNKTPYPFPENERREKSN